MESHTFDVLLSRGTGEKFKDLSFLCPRGKSKALQCVITVIAKSFYGVFHSNVGSILCI